MEECKRQNMPVLGPDVNESFYKFVVNNEGAIRFGLGAIKGVGEGAVESIVEEREKEGKFKDFFDLLKRINLRAANKRCIEALAMAGAFDGFENSHRAMYFHKENQDAPTFIDKAIKHIGNVESRQNSMQQSLFGDSEDVAIPDPEMPKCDKWGRLEQLKKERDVIGIYISGHPLDDYKVEIQHFCNRSISDISDLETLKRDKEIRIGGIVTSVSHRYTKNGKPMGSFVLEDYSDSMQFVLFSQKYIELKNYLEEGYSLFIKGKVENRYGSDQLEFKIHSMNLLSEVMEKLAKSVTIKINLDDLNEELVDKIEHKVSKNKGECPVRVKITDTAEKIYVEMPSRKHKVNCNKFLNDIEDVPNLQFSLK